MLNKCLHISTKNHRRVINSDNKRDRFGFNRETEAKEWRTFKATQLLIYPSLISENLE